MARASYSAGFSSTSNVMAASLYGMPPAGTMAHSFVSAFASELDAFRAYAASFPDRTILLVDTYYTISGTCNAVQVAKAMEEATSGGGRLAALLLDSASFEYLIRQHRHSLVDSELAYVLYYARVSLADYDL